MNKILTEGQLSDKLYEEIGKQNTIYITIISIMVGVILAIAVAYVWQQLKFSNKGIKKLKKRIYKEFEIGNMNNNIDKAYKNNKESRKNIDEVKDELKNVEDSVQKTSENNAKSKDNINRLQKQLNDFKTFKSESIGALLSVHSAQVSLISSTAKDILLSNELNNMGVVIENYNDVKLEKDIFRRILVDVSNGLLDISERKFDDKFKEKIKYRLNEINEYLEKNIDYEEKGESYKSDVDFFHENREKAKKSLS